MDFPIVLSGDLFPVQAFFNAMSDRNLISTLEGFSNRIGAGFNDVVCAFPEEVDDSDEPFTGVKFYIFNEEFVLLNPEFIRLLEQIGLMYLARHPEHQSRIEQLLAEISKT